MSFTFTDQFYTHGVFRVDYYLADYPIHNNSIAIGSLSELHEDGAPFAGDASMWVATVAASEQGLSVRGWVDWPNDLFVRLSVFITDPILPVAAKTGLKRRMVRSEKSEKAPGHPPVEMSAAQKANY
jgi:hypothetical protein